MAYLAKQISSILNDVIEDMTGQSSTQQTISTTDIVSMGKDIQNLKLTEGFFGSLINRLAKTVYFVRNYDGKQTNAILRDEHEFGAFVQKVYYTSPVLQNNSEYGIPSYTGGGAIDEYTQSSPYDVNTTVTVTAKIFSSQGTYSLNIVRPVEQIRTAFLSDAEMMRFIDGIYLTIENEMKLAEEALISTAVTTAMAMDIKGGKVRNLLTEYNTLYSTNPITDGDEAMRDPDFLRFAAKEILQAINYMQDMSTAYNVGGYMTFTDRENMRLEMLQDFASSLDTYLYSDTFHKDLIELKGFERWNKWAWTGNAGGSFATNSAIKVQHDDFIVAVTNPTGIITQDGIVAFVHDVEHVAAYFGHRRSWELYNPKDDVYIHGETARKGYAVDPNANGVVFVVKYVAP